MANYLYIDMISSSIRRLLATLVLHSSFSLRDQYMGLKVDHGEDQLNLKSKWALNWDQFYGLIVAAFFGGFPRVQQPPPHVTVHWTKNMCDIHKLFRSCITAMQADSECTTAARTHIRRPYSEQKEKNQVITKIQKYKQNYSPAKA